MHLPTKSEHSRPRRLTSLAYNSGVVVGFLDQLIKCANHHYLSFALCYEKQHKTINCVIFTQFGCRVEILLNKLAYASQPLALEHSTPYPGIRLNIQESMKKVSN